jgi:cytosine deaminase
MDNDYVSKLIPLMAESGLHVVANPLVNILIQGRHDIFPKRRGLTRVAELRAAGLTVAFGSDCMLDPWYPLGAADMLDAAYMAVHVGQLSSLEAMRWCVDAVTTAPARIMGLEGYGLQVGDRADLVLLQARDPIDALRTRATRLAVVKGGRIVAETAPRTTRLDLPGRPTSVAPEGPVST